MRDFDPFLAEIRFGYGLSPHVVPPDSVEHMLDQLAGPDNIQSELPIEEFSQFRARMSLVKQQREVMRARTDAISTAEARKQRNKLNKEARLSMYAWAGQTMLRRSVTRDGFRERLVAFWADHFTAFGKQGVSRRATTPYVEEAIRPHITGHFADLAQSAIMHPLMLMYLDQHVSIGPNSARAVKRGTQKPRGLNENLAREVLELHTLGVDGPYTQTDVTQLAELFTGLSFDVQNGFRFRKDFAEPGTETVVGVTYGDAPDVETVRAALRDLALHPSTARHLAWKLAVHFTSDTPDPALVNALEAAFRENGGQLMPVYRTLLEQGVAWTTELRNIKPPIDFVSSALRALGLNNQHMKRHRPQALRRHLGLPLQRMGQQWERPLGPDGWAEEDTAWVTPQGLAARIDWAMQGPAELIRALPDPRGFPKQALGGFATDVVRFAASSAESRREAIGLVLMSPAFQRR